MKPLLYSFLLCTLLASSLPANKAVAEEVASPIKATTVDGDKAILYPNGRWEFVDVKKAAEAQEIAKQFPENQGCPPGTQGGYLGLGRCVPIGDKDYNRGSLSGKGR